MSPVSITSTTNTIHSKIIIPAAYYLRGDLRFWYFHRYKKNLKKSGKQIKDYQLGRLKKLIKHAYDTVPYYTALFNKLGLKPEDFKGIADLKKIPVLDKTTLLKNLKQLKSTKSYKLKEYTSGGSTGNRSVVYKDKRYEEISRAIFMRDLDSIGIKPGDKVAWVWSSPIEAMSMKKRILERLLWKINRRILFNPLTYTDEQMEAWLRKDFARFNPDYIYGYPNAIYELAKLIQKKQIHIPKIKKIVCSAHKLEHREFIEKAFKCKVLDQYGSREVFEIAIEDDNYTMHSADDFVIVELGQDNEILLTPLESYGMPLLRYAIGDVGLASKKQKQDSHPFKQFNLAIGRSCEIMLNSKGQKVSSSKINLKVSKEKLNIGGFQLVQKSLADVELNIVKDEQTSKKDVERFCVIIKEILGCKSIRVNYLKSFPLEKSGKKIGYKCLIKEVD